MKLAGLGLAIIFWPAAALVALMIVEKMQHPSGSVTTMGKGYGQYLYGRRIA